MWYNDDDADDDFDELDNIFEYKWTVRIDGDDSIYCEKKEDAVEYILDFVDDEFPNVERDLTDIPGIDGISDYDDLFDVLMYSDIVTFNDIINAIVSHFDSDITIKLINTNDDEPEFNEL